MYYLNKESEIINLTKETIVRIIINESEVPPKFSVDMDGADGEFTIESFKSKDEAKIFTKWLMLCLEHPFMLHNDFLNCLEEGNK